MVVSFRKEADNLHYINSVDFSSDSRMSLVSDDSCVSISGRKITIVSDSDAQGCPASKSVSVYAVVDFGSSSLTSEPLTVSLVRFSSLELLI